MELDITHMIEDADDMIELSGSCMEHGQDAACITWNNAMEYGRQHVLLTSETALDAAREYFAGFGAWSREEIAAWDDADLQAITCQEIAARIREGAEQSGQIYQGDDQRWYFYLGS
jgi:hypothetical protein